MELQEAVNITQNALRLSNEGYQNYESAYNSDLQKLQNAVNGDCNACLSLVYLFEQNVKLANIYMMHFWLLHAFRNIDSTHAYSVLTSCTRTCLMLNTEDKEFFADALISYSEKNHPEYLVFVYGLLFEAYMGNNSLWRAFGNCDIPKAQGSKSALPPNVDIAYKYLEKYFDYRGKKSKEQSSDTEEIIKQLNKIQPNDYYEAIEQKIEQQKNHSPKKKLFGIF